MYLCNVRFLCLLYGGKLSRQALLQELKLNIGQWTTLDVFRKGTKDCDAMRRLLGIRLELVFQTVFHFISALLIRL